jgi:hypothetical protein
MNSINDQLTQANNYSIINKHWAETIVPRDLSYKYNRGFSGSTLNFKQTLGESNSLLKHKIAFDRGLKTLDAGNNLRRSNFSFLNDLRVEGRVSPQFAYVSRKNWLSLRNLTYKI